MSRISLKQWSRGGGGGGGGGGTPIFQCTPNELVLYIVHTIAYYTCYIAQSNPSKMNTVLKTFFTEVHKLLKLYLTIPVTTASSERNFSALKCIETYLRNSITQQSLNHCMLFHIHQERTGALDLKSVAKEFTPANERRIAFFNQNCFGPLLTLDKKYKFFTLMSV